MPSHSSMRLPPSIARMWRIVLRCLQDGRCYWCNEPMVLRTNGERKKNIRLPNEETFEHLRPRRHQGKNELSNLALVHYRCNR